MLAASPLTAPFTTCSIFDLTPSHRPLDVARIAQRPAPSTDVKTASDVNTVLLVPVASTVQAVDDPRRAATPLGIAPHVPLKRSSILRL